MIKSFKTLINVSIKNCLRPKKINKWTLKVNALIYKIMTHKYMKNNSPKNKYRINIDQEIIDIDNIEISFASLVSCKQSIG